MGAERGRIAGRHRGATKARCLELRWIMISPISEDTVLDKDYRNKNNSSYRYYRYVTL